LTSSEFLITFQHIMSIIQSQFRYLVETSTTAAVANKQSHGPVRWKASFWEPNSVDPAMMRVPVVLIAFIFLWSANIFMLDRCCLSYHGVLGIKSGPLYFSLMTAIFMSVLYGFHMALSRGLFETSTEVAIVSFYVLVCVTALPCFPGSEHRSHFYRIMRQIIFPGATISFPEILVADALTSVSKVLKDLGVTFTVFYARSLQSGQDPVLYHDPAMLLISLLASLPFVLRIRQCYVQLSTATERSSRTAITLNIIKYFSAFPPIWLAAAASLGYFHPLLPSLTALMATINSAYSFIWDIVMDWGLLSLYAPPQDSTFRPRTVFPFYLHIIVATLNLILRFSWASNRIQSLASLPASHLVLMIELAEVMRRSMWNIFRIEWEINQVNRNLSLKGELPEKAVNMKHLPSLSD